MASKKTTRVQLELPPKSMERIAHLKDVTEASSYAEVIRNALRLYESMVEEAESGNNVTVTVEDKAGEKTSYKIFA